ncbi:hypothetical protein MPNT_20178 [Candidatus Methylacidithermus pantelleriae]|uniref:Uncharacterized protein n=1 Tax=Candidatus Methylacidithermus pantelleriae TaxID=2744239 RepID=A0A8J2BPG3_9BACT|nr:hypothetical protein MPNT_20178 [Candidatus Methylacidithermus pantelleriae]
MLGKPKGKYADSCADDCGKLALAKNPGGKRSSPSPSLDAKGKLGAHGTLVRLKGCQERNKIATHKAFSSKNIRIKLSASAKRQPTGYKTAWRMRDKVRLPFRQGGCRPERYSWMRSRSGLTASPTRRGCASADQKRVERDTWFGFSQLALQANRCASSRLSRNRLRDGGPWERARWAGR